MKRSSLVFALTCAFLGQTQAAEPGAGEIRGRAVRSGDSAGLTGVNVSVQGEARATLSGANGAFFLTGVTPGAHVIECALPGYRTDRVAVSVPPGGVVQMRCQLTAEAAAPESPPVATARPEVDDILGGLSSTPAADPVPREAPKMEERSARRDIAAKEKMKVPMSASGVGQGGGGYSYGTIGAGNIGTVGRGRGVVTTTRSGSVAYSADTKRYAPPRPSVVMPAPRGPIAAHPVAPASMAPGMPPMQTLSPDEASREGYDSLVENDFLAVTQEPLSTFSIDVDSASYANVRRFLRDGHRPPKDAVRVEELINYFRYDYANPTGTDPFSINTEVSSAPWKPEHRLVRVGLQGQRIPAAHLPPSNLTFLIDVSGSMNSPAKLPLLKQSFRLLVDQLRSQDRVSIVVYAGAAGVVLPPTEGGDKSRIIEAIENLHAGGSTAGAAGIRLAYQVAREGFVRGGNNRVVLATDGDFNVGVSSDGELVSLIEQERKSGVFLTVLGFGMGNYQDAKMQKLADAGNGNHAYIDDLEEARKTLVAEMGATLLTIAKDMKVQVEFNPARVKAYRLIGYENRRLANEDFNNDQKDAGELGAGHSVTVLYEIVPAGSSEPVPGVDELKYQATAPTAAAASSELLTVKLRYKAPAGDTSKLITNALVDTHTALGATSDDFRFATAVAEFGLVLRNSPHKGGANLGAVLSRASTALGRNEGGLRTGFLELVRKASAISGVEAQALAR